MLLRRVSQYYPIKEIILETILEGIYFGTIYIGFMWSGDHPKLKK